MGLQPVLLVFFDVCFGAGWWRGGGGRRWRVLPRVQLFKGGDPLNDRAASPQNQFGIHPRQSIYLW